MLDFLNKRLEEILGTILLTVMTVSIFAQVLYRFAGLPLSWTEELARYCFVWLIYITCSFAIQQSAHIKVDVLTLVFRKKGNFVLEMISLLMFFTFAVIALVISAKNVYSLAFLKPQISAGLHCPMWIPNLGITIGLMLMLIRLAQSVCRTVEQYKKVCAEEGGKE